MPSTVFSLAPTTHFLHSFLKASCTWRLAQYPSKFGGRFHVPLLPKATINLVPNSRTYIEPVFILSTYSSCPHRKICRFCCPSLPCLLALFHAPTSSIHSPMSSCSLLSFASPLTHTHACPVFSHVVHHPPFALSAPDLRSANPLLHSVVR